MESFYSKNTFYVLLSFGVFSVSSGLYFLYKSFNEEKEKEKKTKNTQNVPIVKESRGGLKKQLGLEIFNKITFAYEEHLDQTDTKHHKMTRMSYLERPEEYARLAGAIMGQRQKDYVNIRDKFLKEYNITEQQYQDFLGQITMAECEISLFSNYQPKLNAIPDATAVKEAFTYFAETMLNIHQLYSGQDASLRSAYLLIEKIRLEDDIYLRYGVSYFQLRYFIHQYNLLQDSTIREYYNILPYLK
jgi:hypothetical protein